LGGPGIILQIGGQLTAVNKNSPQSLALLGEAAMFIGTVLLITGLCYYAKAKGHSPVWGLAGLLSCLGLLILALLKDKAKDIPPPLPN
jgi:hypothetical protein